MLNRNVEGAEQTLAKLKVSMLPENTMTKVVKEVEEYLSKIDIIMQGPHEDEHHVDELMIDAHSNEYDVEKSVCK